VCTCLVQQTNTGGRAVVLPLVRAIRYVLSRSIATANRSAATAPHRKWSMLRLEKRCGKQPPVSSLAFKTERFIPAVKNPLRFQPLVCASPYASLERGNEIWNECYRYRHVAEVYSFEMVYDITLIYQQTACFFTADLASWFRSKLQSVAVMTSSRKCLLEDEMEQSLVWFGLFMFNRSTAGTNKCSEI